MLFKNSGQMGARSLLLYMFASFSIVQWLLSSATAHAVNTCNISPNSLMYPNSTCQSVFHLPGALPSRLHYLADGAHAWVAAKFAYLPDVDAIEYLGGSPDAPPNFNYYISRSLLQAVVSISSDIVMAEASSFVFANMASTARFETVRSNILNDCAWFSNTHGLNTLDNWMSPMAPGYNIPDAQQTAMSSCQGRYGASACGDGGSKFVFDSCGNNGGSNLHTVHLFRMRCPSTSSSCDSNLNSTHSIWFRIPISYRRLCEDSAGQLLSASPSSAPMLSFTSITLVGHSFLTDVKYNCVFHRPFPFANISLIRANYVSSTTVVCYIAADFVAPDFAMPIGLEQEVCSGGSCSMCPIPIMDSSSQRHSAYYLLFYFLPSLLKPTENIVVTVASKIALTVAGGNFNLMTNLWTFPNTVIILADSKGFNMSIPGIYVPGSWPVGVLEFMAPEWPNDSALVCLTTSIANNLLYSTLYSIEPVCVTFLPSWKGAFPLEVSAISNQINISGSRFSNQLRYSCMFTPLIDDTSIDTSNIVVDARYVSFNTLRCAISASAGRYRLNMYENGIAIIKLGASCDVIVIEKSDSVSPLQILASGSEFSLTVSGTGFDPDARITHYECIVTAREQAMVSSISVKVRNTSVNTSPQMATNQIVCTFAPWIYSSGAYELQLINRRFNRYISGSALKFVMMPTWTSIFPSSGLNVLSSMITLMGYGFPVSLHVEATFRSAQDPSQSAKTLSAIPQSPFRVVLESPIWYFTSLIAVVDLAVASSSNFVSFTGNSRTFGFSSAPPTLTYSPSVFDCSSSMIVVLHNIQRLSTNGSGYQCRLFNNVTQVTVPATFVAESNVQCRFGSWLSATVPSTLQLLYFGSTVAISRTAPLCQQKLSRILPTVVLSGSRSQITVFGSFLDVSLKYECVVGGLKYAAVYLNPSNAFVVCTIDAPQTSSTIQSLIALVASNVESNSFPLVVQTAWHRLYPSVVCLNSGSLLTVIGSFFSQNNKHELVFDYQSVAIAEYLKGTYVKPFPLPRSLVATPGIEVVGSTIVVFDVPFSHLSDAIEIQVSLRINGVLVPVGGNRDTNQFSLPFFTSSAEFDPQQLHGIVSYYDARDLKFCDMPSCRWHPRAGITGALVGTAELQDGWVMSPAFVSESSTKIVASEYSTLIIGFTPPLSGTQSRQFIASHGSLPSRARMALWLPISGSSSVQWADDLGVTRAISISVNGSYGPYYWIGSYSNNAVKQSLNTADHFEDFSSVGYPVALDTEDSPLVVGSCLYPNPDSASCNFKGGVKFVILFDRVLSSQEHLNIARWAAVTHGLPSFSRSNASFVRPFGIFPVVKTSTFSTCAKPLSDLNYDDVPACQTHPFQSLGHFSNGISCISAHRGSFHISLSEGFYARSPQFQGENWLFDPASSFVCEISSASGFQSSVRGTIVSANYSENSESNFVKGVIIECDMSSLSLIASLPNSTFRYVSNCWGGSDHHVLFNTFAVWPFDTKHFSIIRAVDPKRPV
jgi:hypothetical protein